MKLFAFIITMLSVLSATAQTSTTDTTLISAEHNTWNCNLEKRLNCIAAECDTSHYYTGISVWDLTADTLLWHYNANKSMRPASTQKISTIVSALDTLGATYELQTTTYHTGTITEDSILNGDIYVVGGFDPMYSYSDLHQLAISIAGHGIKHINGNVYADTSLKNADLYGNGWCWDDVPSKNQPYLCPLMLEKGTLHPNYKTYSTDPAFHPAQHFVQTLTSELLQLGIETSNNISTTNIIREYNNDGTIIHTQSRSIEQVIWRLLKDSDNLHAEAIFHHLAYLYAGKKSTWRNGAEAVSSTIIKAGGDIHHTAIADGSGVSLYNYTTPQTQVALLSYAYKNKDIYTYLYPALPIAGVDGTLSNRMKNGSAYTNIHAKTGTVRGCSCLCGYATASNGHMLAFSIMNNGVTKAYIARDLQDRICQELTR